MAPPLLDANFEAYDELRFLKKKVAVIPTNMKLPITRNTKPIQSDLRDQTEGPGTSPETIGLHVNRVPKPSSVSTKFHGDKRQAQYPDSLKKSHYDANPGNQTHGILG